MTEKRSLAYSKFTTVKAKELQEAIEKLKFFYNVFILIDPASDDYDPKKDLTRHSTLR